MVQTEVFHMELKLSKSTPCTLDLEDKWSHRAAAWMGLAFFLRMVYYFGLKNLNDVPGGEVFLSVVLPLIISVAFILVLKLPKLPMLNYPITVASLSLAVAVNYFFMERMNFGGVLSGLLILLVAGMILAAVLGYIPQRKWLLWAAMAAIAFRALFVDLFGYILPLTKIDLVAYVPMASNLFGAAAVCCVSATLKFKKSE